MKYKKAKSYKSLPIKALRWKCDTSIFNVKTTKELQPIEGIVGQDRALKAIKLGMGIKSPGYNIYISGLSGTGKTTTVKQILETISTEQPQLLDYAYVNNFAEPDRPISLSFQAGGAKEFRKEMKMLIEFLRDKIPQLLEGETYRGKRKELYVSYETKENKLLVDFQQRLIKDGFVLGQTEIDGKMRSEILLQQGENHLPIHQLDELVRSKQVNKEQAKEIATKFSGYQEEFVEVYKQSLKLNKELKQSLENLEQNEVESIVRASTSSIREKYSDAKISAYLDTVEIAVLESLEIFRGVHEEQEGLTAQDITDLLGVFDVNVVLDNSQLKTAPVFVELSPTYQNIFGTIDKEADDRGTWYADFRHIRAGSLLKANGGYLVINVSHLFEFPGVWKTLKRILSNRKLEIQENASPYQIAPVLLKPEPIDINVKVIFVGSSYVYNVLSSYEDDFKKIFKVKAEFDSELERNDEILVEYARVIKKMITDENLLEFNSKALSYLLELAARYVGNRNKLSGRFSVLADLAREADYWARSEDSPIVTAAYVKKAYEEAKARYGLYEEKVTESYLNNIMLVQTSGEAVGQVNGLVIYGSEFYAFGKPTKITANVGIGSGNIINVERESGMSGKSFDKAVLIITGYLRETFGQDFPLSFTASMVFEQSYGGIDGDSASAAEMCVLLSALSGVPIKQSLAITGSLNQKGQIQPIGGVNEKIEGFFNICKMRGLTGEQGVIIPVQNLSDLMLNEEVIESVKKKEFHIFAVEHINEALELFTGVHVGVKREDGSYEPGTLSYLVVERLRSLFEKARRSPARDDKRKGAPEKQNETPKKTGKQK